jgi:hypothetical protein
LLSLITWLIILTMDDDENGIVKLVRWSIGNSGTKVERERIYCGLFLNSGRGLNGILDESQDRKNAENPGRFLLKEDVKQRLCGVVLWRMERPAGSAISFWEGFESMSLIYLSFFEIFSGQ